jgi:hypothetical protein
VSSEPHFVYLAPASDRSRFKVGLSASPTRRLLSLIDDIDLTQVWVIECESFRHARGLERTLHFMFRQHAVVPHVASGCTEWFSTVCWDSVLSFIEGHQSHLGYFKFELLPSPPARKVKVVKGRPVPIGREVESEAISLSPVHLKRLGLLPPPFHGHVLDLFKTRKFRKEYRFKGSLRLGLMARMCCPL